MFSLSFQILFRVPPFILSIAAFLFLTCRPMAAVEPIFQDDFSAPEADGRASLVKWTSPVGESSPQRSLRVVSDGLAQRFGAEGNALRIYKNEKTVAQSSASLTSPDRWSKSAPVVTVTFDFWDDPAVTPGAAVLRLGTGNVPASHHVHEVQFRKGMISGVPDIYTPGVPQRVAVVMNNSTADVTYAGGAAVLESDAFDVWIGGARVLSNHRFGRGPLPVGTALTSLQFAGWTSNRTDFWIRNLRVYEGAQVAAMAAEEEDFEIFLAPDGDDSRDGRSVETAIRTTARAQQLLMQAQPNADARIWVLPGRYFGQQVTWTYTRPGRRIIFEAFDRDLPRPVFDGCTSGGSCGGGTWLMLSFSGGRHTNLEFRHLRFENYQTALSFNGNRNNNAGGYNGGNVVYGCQFRRIGNVFNPAVAPSTAVIRLVNSKDNIIENNDFIDVINTTSGGLIHAVYIAHHSDRNFLLQNRFINNSGDPVRVRDFSNDNLIFDNVHIRAGADGYSEWYCDSSTRTDCTKPTPECPSWGNEYRFNQLVSSWTGGTLGAFRFHQSDTTAGCSPPDDGAVRLRTSNNIRVNPGPIDLWRHRSFTRLARADPATAGNHAAPAGDEVPNLLKYVLGLDPLRPAPATRLPRLEIANGRAGLRYSQNGEATDAGVILERSNDLLHWSAIASQSIESVDENGRMEVRLFEQLPSGDEASFLRLRVQAP